MRAEREDCVCGEDGGCGRSVAPLIHTSGSEAGGGQRLSRFLVSLHGELLAFLYNISRSEAGAPLIWRSGSKVGGSQRAGSPPGELARRTVGTLPSFHTATSMPHSECVANTRMPRPPGLPCLLACVSSTHTCSYSTRDACAARIILIFPF